MGGKGYLIVIEGVDQSGKKTQSVLLEDRMKQEGWDVTSISFPDYDTPLGKEIKKFLASEKATYPIQLLHMLLAANRWERQNELSSWLSAGKVVIANRYSPSNLIYGISRGFDRDWLVNLESGLPDPDVVIVMDIDPASSTQRKNRQRDLNERDDELLTRVRKSYREMSEEKGWHLIDGEGAIDRIHEDIWRVIKSFFDRVGPESR